MSFLAMSRINTMEEQDGVENRGSALQLKKTTYYLKSCVLHVKILYGDSYSEIISGSKLRHLFKYKMPDIRLEQLQIGDILKLLKAISVDIP